MSLLGNVLWFVLGGIIMGLLWLIAGVIWCVTIIGVPWGVQCFKFAALTFFPFGKTIEYGGGAGSLLLNIVWLLISGLPMSAANAIIGCLFCMTIVGIPFGKQYFKIAKLALLPFGASVV
jgi:uncharacterized membrane protein YccF (DUF307 family)